MTKGKKIISRMMFVLVVLTLVSFCFVGFTFARYTSSGDGTATATIAKWSVSGTYAGTDTASVSMDKISPSTADPVTSYDANTARKNESDPVLVFTITNASEVKASVTLSIDTITVNKVTDAPASVTDDMVKSHLKVEFCNSTGTVLSGAQKLDAVGGTATVLEVYAKITWTSDISATIFGEAADEEDTLIGQYVRSLSLDISYTAVQDSELPA